MWKSRLINSSSTSLSSAFPATQEWKTGTGSRSLSLPTPSQPSPALVLVALWKAETINGSRFFFLKGESIWGQGSSKGGDSLLKEGNNFLPRHINRPILFFGDPIAGGWVLFQPAATRALLICFPKQMTVQCPKRWLGCYITMGGAWICSLT